MRMLMVVEETDPKEARERVADGARHRREQPGLSDQAHLPAVGRQPDAGARLVLEDVAAAPVEPYALDQRRPHSLQARQSATSVTEDPQHVRIGLERERERASGGSGVGDSELAHVAAPREGPVSGSGRLAFVDPFWPRSSASAPARAPLGRRLILRPAPPRTTARGRRTFHAGHIRRSGRLGQTGVRLSAMNRRECAASRMRTIGVGAPMVAD